MNEKLRILKLLEEGKISAEEAARLLEALNETSTKKKERPFGFWSSMEGIPGMITSAIAGSFNFAKTNEKLQFPRKKKIEFKGISGDIEIIGTETEMIELQTDGFAKIKEGSEVLEIKAISGDVIIIAPKTIDLEIRGLSGDLDISNISSEIEIASVSGDIEGVELSGNLQGDFVSGDIDLSYKKIGKIKIKSKTGDIVLRLNEDIAAELNIETMHGEIECEFELKNKEVKKGQLKGIINNPGAKIDLENEYGNVAILKRR